MSSKGCTGFHVVLPNRFIRPDMVVEHYRDLVELPMTGICCK